MQTFSLVLDDASLLWVVVCLYSILSCHRFIRPSSSCLGESPCSLSHLPQMVFMEASSVFYPFTSRCHHPPAITMPPLTSL
ncbi:hypothetical protein B0H14DRAFT_2924627, partial [Mycena olivaceomarginata]